MGNNCSKDSTRWNKRREQKKNAVRILFVQSPHTASFQRWKQSVIANANAILNVFLKFGRSWILFGVLVRGVESTLLFELEEVGWNTNEDEGAGAELRSCIFWLRFS
ncbi:hypothetical protein CDAR_540821 [Caerostris darwini]|uniref:Uncharacterized protein n=1 Tax=Caerostris darwini TaxID=1538125 RepID=A0AAV4NFZ2_9ARAC|nr:hypothetical protein CDAR_540821 [Caerostris darwini]